MGNNLDLVQILGLPATVECPTCTKKIPTNFDDYDIECGDPILGGGLFKLDGYCQNCKNSYIYKFKIILSDIAVVKED